MTSATALLLLGPPASGKGTIARYLMDHYPGTGVFSASTELSRASVDSDTKELIDHCLASGQLVPDETVLGILLPRLVAAAGEKNLVILDGFPRTLGQARALDAESLQVALPRIFLAAELELNRETIVERTASRGQCPHCGSSDDLKARVCRLCGGELQARLDDVGPLVRARIDQHEASVPPVREYYRERGLHEVYDARGGSMAIARELLARLQENRR
ncbi:MAG TPA: nucleoside monophosphate kinase [Polyangiaceae bacterium]|jgi:adenylate kinase|nr:nucleoside monophosphate kinase [Polyangiaceae bacterium]